MNPEQNKETVKAFYDLMFNQCRPAEAVGRYVGDSYTQHNPVEDGKQGFISYFERMAKEYPGKRVHFVRVFAEGNYVILHTRQSGRAMPIGPAWIFFGWMGTGKIIEHWDVLQRVPTKSANSNSMF